MVRILKVKDLQEQKLAILERSEMYRQTLTADVEEIQSSALALKRKFGLFGISSLLLKLAVPLTGMFLFRKPPVTEKPRMGFVPKVMLGIRLFRQAWSVLRGIRSRKHNESREGSFTRYS